MQRPDRIAHRAAGLWAMASDASLTHCAGPDNHDGAADESVVSIWHGPEYPICSTSFILCPPVGRIGPECAFCTE